MREKKTPHPVATREKALELMHQDCTARQIAEALLIPLSTARQWRRNYLIGKFEIQPTRQKHSKYLRLMAQWKFREKKGFKVVARELQLPESTVRDWYKQYKAGTFKTTHKHRKKLNEEDKKTILKLAEKGYSVRKIEKKTCLEFYQIRYFLRTAKKVISV